MKKKNINNFPIIPSKKLGQNFLIDKKIINNIELLLFNISNISDFDLILEIGPGTGNLTDILIQFDKPIYAIEYDKRLFNYLKNKFAQFNNLILLNDDILETNFQELFKTFKKVIVIANVPYNISSQIIIKCLKEIKILQMFLMLQKDFADRLIYKNIGTRNALVNIVNYYCDVEKKFFIPAKSFYPAPKINSEIIQFNRILNEKFDNNFYIFLKNIFINKRKKMLNNSTISFHKNKVIEWLENYNLPLNIRAEQLNAKLLNNLYYFLK